MIQLVIALAVAGVLAAGAYFKGRTDGAEPWIEQVAAVESELHDARAAIEKQNAAVAALRARAAARKAEAERARAREAELARDLAARERELMEARAEVPEDPCQSACRLLSRPL